MIDRCQHKYLFLNADPIILTYNVNSFSRDPTILSMAGRLPQWAALSGRIAALRPKWDPSVGPANAQVGPTLHVMPATSKCSGLRTHCKHFEIYES